MLQNNYDFGKIFFYAVVKCSKGFHLDDSISLHANNIRIVDPRFRYMDTHGGIRFFNIDNAFSWTIQSVEKRPPCTDDKVTRGGREGLNLDKPSHEFSNYPSELHIYIYIYIFVCFEKKGEMNLLLWKHWVLMRSSEL